MPLVVRAVARSHVGLVRAGNEDSGYAGRSLFVIADGMGGHAAGEVASRTVVAALLGLDGADLGADMSVTLRRAVNEANDRLRLAVEARPDLDGMGTTLTALVWDGTQLGLVNVGDSRAYLLRGNHLTRLSHDQSLVQTLVDEGHITEAEARTHPQRAVILQALDGRADLDPDISMLDPREGDRYLIGSDGLTDYVAEAAVEEALRDRSASAAVDGLIGLALEAGAPDNVTVIVVDLVLATESDAPNDPPDAATHAPGGILVGAVGETTIAGQETASPLGRPTQMPEDSGTDESETDESEADEPAPRGRAEGVRRRRWPWLVGIFVLLIAAGAFAARSWASDQWYVGVDNGNVAIYSGVDLTLGPLSLSAVSQRIALEVATLPEFARAEVEGGITAATEEDAAAIVSRLQLAANSCLSAPDTAGCP